MRVFRLFFTLLISVPIVSCSMKKEERVFEYDDFSHLKISWNELLIQEKNSYFVYIYSEYCSHCNHIKQDVLNFVFNHQDMFYLIQYVDKIPIGFEVENTIGKSCLNDIFIKGTPTLLSVSQNTVMMNIAGERLITQYIENYPTYL